MVGGAVRGRRPQFGGNIAGMNAVQQAEAELSRLELLSNTVDAALTESAKTNTECVKDSIHWVVMNPASNCVPRKKT